MIFVDANDARLSLRSTEIVGFTGLRDYGLRDYGDTDSIDRAEFFGPAMRYDPLARDKCTGAVTRPALAA